MEHPIIIHAGQQQIPATLTSEHSASSYGVPIILLDDVPLSAQDLAQKFAPAIPQIALRISGSLSGEWAADRLRLGEQDELAYAATRAGFAIL